MKIINQTKYERVKSYIQQNLSVIEIRAKIQEEFQGSISNATIKALRNEMYCKNIDPSYEIASLQFMKLFMEITESIKSNGSLNADQYNTLIKTNLDFQLMEKVKGMLKL